MKAERRENRVCDSSTTRPGAWTGYVRANKPKEQIAKLENDIKIQEAMIKSDEKWLRDNPNSPFVKDVANRKLACERDIVKAKRQIKELSVSNTSSNKETITSTFKKTNEEKAYAKIVEVIKNQKENGFIFSTVEKTINITNIHPNIIKKIFIRLNREGILSQGINEKQNNQWVATSYRIL